jgi:hypothetical protein
MLAPTIGNETSRFDRNLLQINAKADGIPPAGANTPLPGLIWQVNRSVSTLRLAGPSVGRHFWTVTSWAAARLSVSTSTPLHGLERRE